MMPRTIAEVPLRTLDQIARENGIETQVRDLPDLRKTRHLRIRSSFRDRFDATVNELRHDPVFTHWLAAAAGVFLTVLSAIFWGWVL